MRQRLRFDLQLLPLYKYFIDIDNDLSILISKLYRELPWKANTVNSIHQHELPSSVPHVITETP